MCVPDFCLLLIFLIFRKYFRRKSYSKITALRRKLPVGLLLWAITQKIYFRLIRGTVGDSPYRGYLIESRG